MIHDKLKKKNIKVDKINNNEKDKRSMKPRTFRLIPAHGIASGLKQKTDKEK